MPLTYCSSEATAGHESFGCLNPDGHAGLHRASATHGRCPNCGGIEDHADTCPTPDLMEDTSQPMQEVVWGDDGIVRLEPYQYDPGRVPTYPLTQRSKVAATQDRGAGVRATPLPDSWAGQRAIIGPSDPTRDDLRPCEYAVAPSSEFPGLDDFDRQAIAAGCVLWLEMDGGELPWQLHITPPATGVPA